MNKTVLFISMNSEGRILSWLKSKFLTVVSDFESIDILDCNPDLIVFEFPIPQFDLPEVIFRKIYKKFRDTSIFVIDSVFSLATRAIFLNLGASMYMAKPLVKYDFLRYCSYYVIKKEISTNQILQYEDIKLDIDSRILSRGGKNFSLRNKEFDLMRFFLINPGVVMTKTRIIESVWDMNADFFNSKTLETHISYLRSKIDNDFEIKRLHTIYCVGYKFE